MRCHERSQIQAHKFDFCTIVLLEALSMSFEVLLGLAGRDHTKCSFYFDKVAGKWPRSTRKVVRRCDWRLTYVILY